jgi:uncharacterized membrane protein
MAELLRGPILVAATLTIGFMTGVFGIYANTIMPGLGRSDDRTFVGAFQAIDRAITNPLFLAIFFSALVLTGAAAALHLGQPQRSVLPWLVVAFVLYAGVFVVTIAVNVPLNDAIKAAGEPDRISDLAAVRARFDEAKWVRWNLFRTGASAIAFGCLVWTLVLHGRLSA